MDAGEVQSISVSKGGSHLCAVDSSGRGLIAPLTSSKEGTAKVLHLTPEPIRYSLTFNTTFVAVQEYFFFGRHRCWSICHKYVPMRCCSATFEQVTSCHQSRASCHHNIGAAAFISNPAQASPSPQSCESCTTAGRLGGQAFTPGQREGCFGLPPPATSARASPSSRMTPCCDRPARWTGPTPWLASMAAKAHWSPLQKAHRLLS